MATYMTGMKELYDRLQMMKTIEQRKLVRQQLRKAAKFTMVMEQMNTPVVTGVLIQQYVVRAIKRTRRGIGYTVRIRPKAGQRWYASFVNYGWYKVPIGPRFIDRAVDAAAQPALDMVVSGVKAELDALGH